MSSLRKKVSSYFRQLSFHNEPREKRLFINENAFVNRYLRGEIKIKEGPPVLHGKTPNDLPNFEVGEFATGPASVVGCATGPNGGLTTVKRLEKHLSIPDVDIDFIDKQDETGGFPNAPDTAQEQVATKQKMKIKVAGQTYLVPSSLEKSRQSLSLSSLVENEPQKKQKQNESNVNNNCICDDKNNQNYAISKSKSAGSSLDKNRKKGKILRLAERPGAAGPQQHLQGAYQCTTNEGAQKWDKKTDTIYGISDSLYDTNQVTREKNGNPIADCFGIIARGDSAVLALADGVNWGEKACIAAKSAVHGSLHYINKTIFDDVSLFNFDVGGNENSPIAITEGLPSGGTKTENTNEVFICLLRAFNSAHNLILENSGMLTTLTVAVVLPLKQGNYKKGGRYICCVCNLGDTFAYVYSPKYGIREITKGSHDILSNRDMRDALGALGPVDGINPELNNLTLSATTLEPGDIVLVASDGLTDNYDPSVCKFTVNQGVYDAPKHKTTNINPHQKVNRPPVSSNTRQQKVAATNISRLASTNHPTKTPQKDTTKNTKCDEVDFSNPLVAQFMQDNALPSSNKENVKKALPLAKSSSSSRVLKTTNQQTNSPRSSSFLRSKTSLDLRQPQIKRNEDGLPLVTPIQKYELTLLLMEDILVRGLSGREAPCTTAKLLCETLVRYTVSVTAAKRRSLEDKDLYYDVRNDVQVEVSSREKKSRRKRCLEKIQNLPGKLDHVTVVAYNVGNCVV